MHLITVLNEKDQIASMARVAQPLVQVVALLEAAGALAYLHDLRLDLGHEGRGAGRIVERDEVANVDQIRPCGRQDNQLRHTQDLSA